MRVRWLTAIVLLALGCATAQAEMPQRGGFPVVLVGDSAAGSDWAKVIALLADSGLRVTAIPAASPDESGAKLRRFLASETRSVVLVAAGPGGAVASEIGIDRKVSALVYVAAPDQAPLPKAAWLEKPSFYAVAEQDASTSTEQQRAYAARMKAKTIVLRSIAEQPREIAGLILEAAGKKPPACGAAEDDGTGACAAPALPRSVAEGCKCSKGSLEDLTAP
jgi:pimeloyl-ACP methyl ester carboxylesterase